MGRVRGGFGWIVMRGFVWRVRGGLGVEGRGRRVIKAIFWGGGIYWEDGGGWGWCRCCP